MKDTLVWARLAPAVNLKGEAFSLTQSNSPAIWSLDTEVPTGAIVDLLGHSSITITEAYAKVVDMNKYTPSEMLQIYTIQVGVDLRAIRIIR
jgi:integrase